MKRWALLFALALPSLAEAGAWTRTEGEFFLAQSTRFFTTGMGGDTPFFRLATDIHAEYGLFDWLTLGVEGEYGERSDLRARAVAKGFARVRLWTGDEGGVFSVEAGGGAPVWRRESVFDMTPDVTKEARLSALYGMPLETPLGPGWADAALTYRYRAGPPADELKLDLTLGLRPFEDWLVMAQAFVTKGRGNNGFTGPDYDVAKLSASVGYDIDETRTLVLGATRDVWTRDMTPGYELKFSVWSRF